jgi:hypothetical protein
MYICEKLKIKLHNFDIIIYGGDIFSNGKNEHDPPHFHIKYDNGKEFTIKIPSVDEWHSNKSLNINSGIGDKEIILYIKDWLCLNSGNYDMINIEYIRYNWNVLNKFNDKTTLFDKVYQHESNLVSKNKTIKNIKNLKILNYF